MTLNLVVVAHPDDEILGFGATGAKLAAAGETVQAVILCAQVEARSQRPQVRQLQQDILTANASAGFSPPVLASYPNIQLNCVPHLELVQFIEHQIVQFQPQRLVTHHPDDLNDDHRQVARACMAAARLFQRKAGLKPLNSLHLMETLSATDWRFPAIGDGFQPNCFIEVEDYLEQKIKALDCYSQVMRDFPHPRSAEIIRGLAAYRGGQAGQRYAEAFQTVFSRSF